MIIIIFIFIITRVGEKSIYHNCWQESINHALTMKSLLQFYSFSVCWGNLFVSLPESRSIKGVQQDVVKELQCVTVEAKLSCETNCAGGGPALQQPFK